MNSYTTGFSVDEGPQEVFAAINNVRGWWSGDIEGSTDQLGAEFTYRYEDVHWSKQRITELVPGKKVVWLVLDAELSFVEDKAEWNGTEISFEIAKNGPRYRAGIEFVKPDHKAIEAFSGRHKRT